MSERKGSRVLLVGWDGADWLIVRDLMRQGRLPHLTRLIESGVIGDLASVRPLLSPLTWTSIITGKRADKHGIEGELRVGEDGQSVRPTTPADRRAATVWEILNRCGLSTHCVNWPCSHPAETVNGVAVSNAFAVGAAPDSVTPADAAAELAKLHVAPDEVNLSELIPDLDAVPPDDARLAMARAIVAQTATVHAAATWAIEHRPWDFAAVLYKGIEHASQAFMAYRPPRQAHVAETDLARFGGVVDRIYDFHDMMLGRLIELAGADATILLASDHGFQSGRRRQATVPRTADESAGVWHHPRGMLVLTGPGLRKDQMIEGAGALDLAPTIMSLFGLPVGADMDGKPLTAAFTETLNIEHVPTWDVRPFTLPASVTPRAPAASMVADANRYNLARSLLDRGAFSSAAELLSPLHDSNPQHLGYLSALLDTHYARRTWAEARRLVESLWDRGMRTPGAMQALANISLGEKKYSTSLEWLQRAEQAYLAGAPSGRDMLLPLQMHVDFGLAYLALSRFAEADRAFERALADDEWLEAAWNGRAVAALAMNRPGESITFSRRAVAVRSDSADAHFNMGMAIAALGNNAEAIRCLQRSLEIKSDVPVVYRKLIELYRAMPGSSAEVIAGYQAKLDELLESRRRARQA